MLKSIFSILSPFKDNPILKSDVIYSIFAGSAYKFFMFFMFIFGLFFTSRNNLFIDAIGYLLLYFCVASMIMHSELEDAVPFKKILIDPKTFRIDIKL